MTGTPRLTMPRAAALALTVIVASVPAVPDRP
jgi:hypothetical protein